MGRKDNMNLHNFRYWAVAGMVLLMAGFFTACETVPTQPRNSFTFDPPAKQPKNPANVALKLSTGAQVLYVVEGNEVLLATPVSVGKAESPTPHGNFTVRNKTRHRRRQSEPGRGYPMTYWIEFYNPAYGMHWGFIRPFPNTMGCVRMPLKSAKKVFDMVRVGTPINISRSQPWDDTIGKSLPVLSDAGLQNPPLSYMLSPQVFLDQEKGKMWNY
jgi:hypothetical protein